MVWFALLSTPTLAKGNAGAVASVEFIAPKDRSLAQVASVERGGRPVSAREIMNSGLRPGDRVLMRDQEAVLLIRYLATRRLVVIRKNANAPGAYQVVATEVPGLTGSLFKTFADAMRNFAIQAKNFGQSPEQGNDEYIMAATRSVATAEPDFVCPNPSGKSNEPIRFRIPALNPYVNHLVAGNRALFVQWRGGVEPYSIALRDAGHKVIAEARDLKDTCSATLPMTALPQGPVDLIVRDGNNARVAIQQIDVDAKTWPEPAALAAARLPAAARTLYYATWLTTQSDGVWTFEAMQMVHALDCRTPGAREWLSQYGQPPVCPDSGNREGVAQGLGIATPK